MSRGGRKRRHPQSEPGQAAADEQAEGQAAPSAPPAASASAKAGDAASRRRRRRRRGREGRPGEGQEAPQRPRRATTLPPDGVVLEEVIVSMQSEYGTPTTPQEYRLLVRVGGRESHAEEAQPAPKREPQASQSQPGPAQGPSGVRRRTRLRRRPRRPGAKQGPGDGQPGSEPEPPASSE
jgi:hypothetical protein